MVDQPQQPQIQSPWFRIHNQDSVVYVSANSFRQAVETLLSLTGDKATIVEERRGFIGGTRTSERKATIRLSDDRYLRVDHVIMMFSPFCKEHQA